MAEDFAKAVEDGLKLSKRLYFGKDRAVTPPKPPVFMDKSAASGHLPTAPMVYAVVPDPGIVDNPDMPSYQPHVHGRCDPPALIPLQMNRIELQADTFLDTAFVRVTGSWRVHCIMGSKACDCKLAIPMGEKGSILGVEVEVSRKVYSTEQIVMDDKKNLDVEARHDNGGFLNSNIFTLAIPKVDGGTNISITIKWTQKLLYHDGELSLIVPFNFPEYVTPPVKKLPKKEKILLNVNTGGETEILCKTTSYPFKEVRREVGKLGFVYETEVLTWTHVDLAFSYKIPSGHISGGLILQSPSSHDFDQREMFCVYLFPGGNQSKAFRREIVFLVDISGSMRGKSLEEAKNALSSAITTLDSKDSFNIIAFNGETYVFSSMMELASEKATERALKWIDTNFVAGGSTNISVPLIKAIEMVSGSHGSIPIIFLVTDGAVEDERHICNVIKNHQTSEGSISPRVCTFGIGTYCNHHFLRMLATISRGRYDAAYDIDSIESRMQKWFSRASSISLANITIDAFDDLDEVEVFPSQIPDLSFEIPLVICGRYKGIIPDTLRLKGVLGDLSNFAIDLKIQPGKDTPLDRISAKQQINLLTAQSWFSENKQLEEKVARISMQTGIISEYTRMSLLETEIGNEATISPGAQKSNQKKDSTKVGTKGHPRRILLQNLGVGFGNLTATADNIPPGVEEPKLPEAAEIIMKAASNCCGKMWNRCCCMCCIQCCSKMNDQCAIVLAQLCTALACFGCVECCSEVCCADGQGH